ncbi:hypothetical protein T439DRAFT_367628, partial [Meredithblackwellia eburnea MCA 4105]
MSPATMDTESTSSPLKIDKLTGPNNWMQWKTDMKMVLIVKGLWSVVAPAVTTDATGNTSAIVTTAFTTDEQEKSYRALAHIHLYCDRSQQLLFRNATDGREAWKKLNEIYSTSDAASRMARKSAFLGLG